MRGHDEQTHHMFSYLSPEQRVPADHPLRTVRALTDQAGLHGRCRAGSGSARPVCAIDGPSVDPT